MLHRILFILCIFSTVFCQAQSLELKKGNVTKTFDKDAYYKFTFVESGESDCDYRIIEGTISRVFADSLKIRPYDISMHDIDLGYVLDMNSASNEKNLNLSISKSAISSIVPYKNKKKHSNHSAINGVGGMLVLTGLITIANSYDLKAKSFRKGLLISSGAQVGIGSLILALNTKKKYRLEDGWHF